MKRFITLIIISLFSINLFPQNSSIKENCFPLLKGPYLGQKLPDSIPGIFAPGIVSTGLNESTLAVSPDGKEIYFVVTIKAGKKFLVSIVETKMVNGTWTKPEVAPFSGLYSDHGPFIHPNGNRFYFSSNRPLDSKQAKPGNTNIWYMDKVDNQWGEPKPIGPPINGDYDAMSASVTRDGTIYFTVCPRNAKQELFRSKLIDNKYSVAERLPDIINSGNDNFDSCISPDESYLLFCGYGRKDAIGSTDYYVSFRDKNDNWTDPVNPGERFNSKEADCTPTITADGKYIFLGGHSQSFHIDNSKPVKYQDYKNILDSPGCGGFDILWVSAKIIEELRPLK